MELRKVVSLWFAVAVAILGPGGPTAAMAQGMPPLPCERWTTPLGLPPGTPIGFIDVKQVGDKLEGYANFGGRIVPGTFVRTGVNPNMVVAIWDIQLDGVKGYLAFSAAREADLLFQSADPRDSTAPIRVKIGFTQFRKGPPRQICATLKTGKLVSVGSEAEPGFDDDEARGPLAGRGWGPRIEEFDDGEPKRVIPRVIRPNPAKPPSSLESLVVKPRDMPEDASPSPAPGKRLMVPAGSEGTALKTPPTEAEAEGLGPIKDAPGICQHPAMGSIPWPWNLAASEVSRDKTPLVGKRYAAPSARLYEFNSVASSFLQKGEVALKKSPTFLTAFQTSGKPREERLGDESVQIVPVTIPGLDLTAGVEAPKTGVPLRIMIVGAPEEIAISGLERIGKELEKDPKLDIKLQVDWHEVTAAGDLLPPISIDGFPALVRAAREKARKDFFITPDEKQFTEFIAKFKALIKGRAQPIDRVIWVKGAYKLPNTAPVLVQELLDAAAASSAIPKAPSGDPERWFYVITARMPGFSVNYVREPVNASNAGEVYIEREVGGATRRLIDSTEAASLARNISGVALIRSRGGPSAATRPSASNLVVNARELFSERGYLLTAPSLDLLAERLNTLSRAWSGDTPAAAVKAAGGAPDASIYDIIDPILPLLDPLSTGVGTKPIVSLGPADQKSAAELVKAMQKLASNVAALMAQREDGVKLAACDYVFMTTEHFKTAGLKPGAVPPADPAEPPATAPEATPAPAPGPVPSETPTPAAAPTPAATPSATPAAAPTPTPPVVMDEADAERRATPEPAKPPDHLTPGPYAPDTRGPAP